MKNIKIGICDDDKALQEILRQKIEQFCNDVQTKLIFVTALSEYVYDAFDVGAFHYLLKPFSDEKLREVLCRALRQYEERDDSDSPVAGYSEAQEKGQIKQSEVILVKKGGISMKVLLDDIIYAEVFNRKIMLHTTHGDIEYYGKLTALSEKAGTDFYRTHRAYLVNLKYVEKYTATAIWLERGTALISKKQFSVFVRRYIRRVAQKYLGDMEIGKETYAGKECCVLRVMLQIADEIKADK